MRSPLDDLKSRVSGLKAELARMQQDWGSGTIPGGCELERGEQARHLRPGDRVEIEIEGIDTLANSIASA